MDTQETILARDFKLPDRTQILCVEDPPACSLAEEYFDQAVDKKRAMKIRNVPVEIFLIRSREVFYVTVMIRQLLVKEIGVESGLILDPGQLQGFIASKVIKVGAFGIVRPSHFPPTSKTFDKYLKRSKSKKELNLYFCKLRQYGDWSSEWRDAYFKLHRGELLPLNSY